ncbi:putative bifunctional diguanylate cyclase/phosphodiesterase [Marinobacterium weihaiense]|uniref:EAL domain-containing protein n=1 Tax=Marinobacterium weihaiense TaxID=2851016 RepID=A0ABS6MDQ4_9GAMM|nr:EAL domain-containing protein [Marinobacterium weihaiense]MBV0934424.1 EAL domain-containing protein [Marinobacterium weihaiense]
MIRYLQTSLARRLTAGFTLLMIILVVVQFLLLVSSFTHYSQFAIDTSRKHLEQVMQTRLEKDAHLLTNTLAAELAIDLQHQDRPSLQQRLQLVRERRNLLYACLFDHQGKLQAPVEQPLACPQQLPAGSNGQAWQQGQLHVRQPVVTPAGAAGQLTLAVNFADAWKQLEQHNQSLAQLSADKSREMLFSLLMATLLLLLAALWLIYRFSLYLFRPLRALADKSLQFGNGDRNISFAVPQQDEIGQLGGALEQMRRSLEQSHRQTHQLAYLDNLTQLPNRHWFQQSLERLLQHARRHDQRLGVIFIDLDHFKEVNDTAGHEMGDLLLFEAAARLRSLLLGMELTDADSDEVLLARLGGDEFVTLYPNLQNSAQVARLAQHIAKVLEEPFLIDGRFFRISSSIGITIYPDDGVNSNEILKHADIAMYAAKQSGRNQYTFFSMQMNQALQQRIDILQGVRTSLEQGHFHLEYQPVVDLSNGNIRGAEALLRWQHPERGPISPALFIPIIEESDLIEPVTRWVARQATADLLTLQALQPGFVVSINISGAALHQGSTRDFLTELKHSRQLPDHCLSIELTETSMIRHLDDCRQTLTQWKAAGMNIWIDDFGTGYSSLSYLHQLPIDGIKIDRSFIRELRTDNETSLAATMITMAHSMSLQVVAEGIETEHQRRCLVDLGAGLGQGFGLHRPMRFAALEQLLEAAPVPTPAP